MPVGAIIAGGAAIGGSILGSRATKKAADKAADTSLQVASQNNALARDIYSQNSALLNPYVTRGNQAGDAINALLGLGGAANSNAPQQPGPMQPVGSPTGLRDRMLDRPRVGPQQNFLRGREEPLGVEHVGRAGGPLAGASANPGPMQTMGPAGTAPSATSAFDNFLNSAGAQYQLDEGYRATNTGYAARGALQSGAALKALQDRGQQTMLNNYFMPYMGLLANQQGVGPSGASAVAGVGQNYVNNVSANNNSAGTAAANAALMRGNANSQMWSGIGGAIGNAFGSSYGR